MRARRVGEAGEEEDGRRGRQGSKSPTAGQASVDRQLARNHAARWVALDAAKTSRRLR